MKRNIAKRHLHWPDGKVGIHVDVPSLLHVFSILIQMSRGLGGGGVNREVGLLQNLTAKGEGGL